MNQPYKILFNFASRSRPQKCLDAMKTIVDNLSDNFNYLIHVAADTDDSSMRSIVLNLPKSPITNTINHSQNFGISKNKIDAINRDVNEVSMRFNWDILVNFSDDMAFTKIGFDDEIRKQFEVHFPDLDGNLHYNDGFTGDKLCTMSIIGRKYYDRFGYIYHPSYKSLFCDDEYTQVAKAAGKMIYIEEPIFVHNHPANVGGESDAQLQHTESFFNEDRITFEKRKANNFKD